MKYLISFGSSGYEKGLAGLRQSAAPFFDRTVMYDPSAIDPAFIRANQRIFDCPRGFGFWLWKPYLIQKTFFDHPDAEFVFYCDSLINFINDPAPLFDICAETKVMLFDQIHTNWSYTKRDCFVLMDCDKEEYHRTKHLNAAFHIWRRSDLAVQLIEDFKNCCCVYRSVSDSPSEAPELPQYLMHRHDQSILTNLGLKYGLPTFRSLCQWGTEWGQRDDSPYPQIVHHHRAK